MQEKQCARCSTVRPLEEFRWLFRHNRGKPERFRDAWCQPCRRAYKREAKQREKANERQWLRKQQDPKFRAKAMARDKEYYRVNRDEIRAKARAKGRSGGWLSERLRRKYGIDLTEYQRLLAAQDNKCKLCGKKEWTKQRRLAVDHCHATQRIRGLLCHHCNTGLGNFMDDVMLLRAAVSYLESNG